MSLAPLVSRVTPVYEIVMLLELRRVLFRSMLARPLLVVLTAPVTFSPPVVSFSVNAPLLVNAPRFATVRSEERRVGKEGEPGSVPVGLSTTALWLIA